jgi:hypothetical protein
MKDPRTLLLNVDNAGLHSDPGTREWIITRRSLLIACLSDIKNNRSTGKDVFEEIKQFGGWQHLVDLKGQPFRSFEHFCENPNGIGLAKPEIERRLSAQELAKEDGVKPARDAKSGRPTNGEKVDNIYLNKGSTTAERIVAKLKRDHPDIAKRLADGEFKSARAAALAAGIKVGQSPLQALRSQWKKANSKERKTFLIEIRAIRKPS